MTFPSGFHPMNHVLLLYRGCSYKAPEDGWLCDEG